MEFYQITDTPPHIQKLLIEGYRRMSPQQKLKRVDQLTKAVQQFALARIRRQYGDIPEGEQKLRLASLWLDRETMIKEAIQRRKSFNLIHYETMFLE